MGMEILYTAILSLVSIVVLFLLCRVAGKRQIAQMSLFDYINSITIGSVAAELATNLEDWHKPLTALVLYGVVTAAAAKAGCKSLKLQQFLEGKPTVLMENGKISRAMLHKASIDLNTFLAQCRAAGYFDLSQLQTVQMEPNGQFSFLVKSDQRPATPADFRLNPSEETMWYHLVLDGKLMREALQESGRSREWLEKQLSAQKIGQITDTFYAGCDRNGQFFACRK